MSDPDQPQIYLITPPAFSLAEFPQALARVLDGVEIACLRLDMASRDADEVARAADALREVAHARDVALVVADHVLLAERLGLDGVHLSDAVRSVREARKHLGTDAIVGSFCAASRHDGMGAGEAGADYVAFGPLGDTGLDAGALAERDLFAWWSEVIEIPVVAEGALSAEIIRDIAPVTDFLALGGEVWGQDDPLAALRDIKALLG